MDFMSLLHQSMPQMVARENTCQVCGQSSHDGRAIGLHSNTFTFTGATKFDLQK